MGLLRRYTVHTSRWRGSHSPKTPRTSVTPGCSCWAPGLSSVKPTARGASQHLHVNVCKSAPSAPTFAGTSRILHLRAICSLLPAAKGCQSPKEMQNGKVHELNLNTGHAVQFQCNKGYRLAGDPLAVCIGGNTWSSTFPSCQRETLLTQRNTHTHACTHTANTTDKILFPVTAKCQLCSCGCRKFVFKVCFTVCVPHIQCENGQYDNN